MSIYQLTCRTYLYQVVDMVTRHENVEHSKQIIIHWGFGIYTQYLAK